MTFACHVDDVPLGEGRVLTLDDHKIAVFRAAGGWDALDAVCPHKGGAVAAGMIAPPHDRRFDLATGEPLGVGEGVTAHTVELRGNRVFVEVNVAVPVA